MFLFMAAVAVAVWVVVRRVDRMTTLDMTGGQSSTCQVHGERMSPKVVALEFGMQGFLMFIDEARPRLFPHADEPYDTGFCMSTGHKNSRVFVCPLCTKARADWLRSMGKDAFAVAP